MAQLGTKASEGIASRLAFPEGKTLFYEGDRPTNAYLIEKGRVEITRTVNHQTVVLGHCGVGEIFGEMALIDDVPRMATVTAVEPTVCIVITPFVFKSQIETSSHLLSHLLKAFTHELRELSKRPGLRSLIP
jgi:CRP/FNR family transcriptional regulator, cyclic AMP receptor protein